MSGLSLFAIFIMRILRIPRVIALAALLAIELLISLFIDHGEFMVFVALATTIVMLFSNSKSKYKNVFEGWPLWFDNNSDYTKLDKNAVIAWYVILGIVIVVIVLLFLFSLYLQQILYT